MENVRKDGEHTFSAKATTPIPVAVTFDPNGGTLADGDNLRIVGIGMTYGRSVNIYSGNAGDFARLYGGVTLTSTGITHILDTCTAAYPGEWMKPLPILDASVGSAITYVLYVTGLRDAPSDLKYMIGAGNGGNATSAMLTATNVSVPGTGTYVMRTSVKNASYDITKVSTDPDLYTFDRAFWTSPSSPASVVGMYATYAFSVYGGYIQYSSLSNRSNPGETISTSLPAPTRAGYRFVGWWTAKTGGTKVTESTSVTDGSAHTLYARWEPTVRELGYDNLFLLCDFAYHPKACTPREASRGTVAADVENGRLTMTRSGTYTGTVYTYYASSDRIEDSGLYAIPVVGGSSYTVSARRESGVGSIWAVYYDQIGTKIGDSTKLTDITDTYTAGTATVPENAAHAGIFFSASSSEFTLSEIRICPSAQCADASYTAVRKPYQYTEDGTYGKLATPTRDGYAFGGWFTGIGGTGRRVTRYDAVSESSITIYSHWVSPFRFGKKDCSDIGEAPFTPICTRPEIGGSVPMSLNIPVPSYALPVPPEDCVCFKFKDGDKTSPIKIQNCTDDKVPQAKLKLKIEPADDDCCTGLYDITPELDITVPCIPFSLREGSAVDGSIKVSNRSGKSDRQIDGEVTSFKLVKPADACCTVQPVIEMKLPDCIKYYDEDKLHLGTDPLKSEQGQIMYCKRIAGGKVATMKHQLISLEKNFKECSVYPVIDPITIPCCMQADFKDEPVGGALTTNAGGSIYVKLVQTDCRPRLEVQVDPITIPNYLVPNISFCLANSEPESVSVTYTDSNGNPRTADNAGTIKLTSENVGNAGCKRYTPSLSLDLTGLSFQASVGSGGNVYQDDNGDLHINGAHSASAVMWYGGGLGDISANTEADKVQRRGPLMRGYTGSGSPYAAYEDDPLGVSYEPPGVRFVPFAYNLAPKLTTKANTGATPATQKKWASSRPAVDSEGNDTTNPYVSNDGTISIKVGESDGADITESYAYGALSMVLPSGLQRHKHGLALMLSEFTWAESGTLSTTEETGYAALISPGPEAFAQDAGNLVTGISFNERNASGLAIGHKTHSGTNNPIMNEHKITQGLSVDDGYGLRIFGRDSKTGGIGGTPGQEVTSASAGRIGSLEVYVKNGFRFYHTDSKTTATEWGTDSTKEGALDLYAHDGDFKFKSDGKLVLNDKRSSSTSTEVFAMGDVTFTGINNQTAPDNALTNTFTRDLDQDYTLPIIISENLYMDDDDPQGWSSVGFGGLSNCRILHNKWLLDSLNAAIVTPSNNNPADYTVNSARDLKTLLNDIISILGYFRLAYMHIGKAGMIIGVDGNRSASSIRRNTDTPAQQSSP